MTAAELDEYITDHVVLVACLVMLGHEYTETVWEGSYCSWVFVDSPAIQDVVMQFEAGDLLFEPKRFNDTLMRIKKDMFSKRDGINANRHGRRTRT